MHKTIATSSSHQLLLKDNCYGLDDEDITVMIESLEFARNELDMDNMDAIYRLDQIIDALKLTTAEKVKFYGIDRFNRPVFKSLDNGKSKFYGDVHNLFGYEATESEVLAKVTADDLCYFGSRFDCEPYGTPVNNLTIVKS